MFLDFARLDELDKIEKENPDDFSETLQTERQILFQNGFPNWNKKDFNKFISNCETFGR